MPNLRNAEKIVLGSFHGTGSDAEDLTLVSTLRDSIVAGFDLPANRSQHSYKHIHDFESFEYQGPGTPSAPSTKTLLGQSFSKINQFQDLAHGKTSMELNIEQAVTDFGERIQTSQLPGGRKVRLVLQGWSRGAASALAVAQQLARQYPKTDYDYEIDLYLFEPCVGPTQRDFCWDVPDNVKHLQVFSNVDENNPVFISPKLKVLDTEQTASKHYLMRGRHSSGVKGKTIGKADEHVFLTTMDIACTDLLTCNIPVDWSEAFYTRTASINGHGHRKVIEKGVDEKSTYELLKSIEAKVTSYQNAWQKKYGKTYPYTNSLAYDLLIKNEVIVSSLKREDKVSLEKLARKIYAKLNKIASCQPDLTKKRGDIINQDGRSIVSPNFFVSQYHAELFKSVARYTYAAMFSKTNGLFAKEIEKELMGLYENKCYDVLLNLIKHIDLNPYDLKLRCLAEKINKIVMRHEAVNETAYQLNVSQSCKDMLETKKREEACQRTIKDNMKQKNNGEQLGMQEEQAIQIVTKGSRQRYYDKIWQCTDVDAPLRTNTEDVFYTKVRALLKDYSEDWFFKNRHHRHKIRQILKIQDNVAMYTSLLQYYANIRPNDIKNASSLVARCEYMGFQREKHKLANVPTLAQARSQAAVTVATESEPKTGLLHTLSQSFSRFFTPKADFGTVPQHAAITIRL